MVLLLWCYFDGLNILNNPLTVSLLQTKNAEEVR